MQFFKGLQKQTFWKLKVYLKTNFIWKRETNTFHNAPMMYSNRSLKKVCFAIQLCFEIFGSADLEAKVLLDKF